jgi:catechol 2,3-dioxygenase-like lactoylglutathione lyase family enzyme
MKMNLTLGAEDLTKTRIFYRDILGLHVENADNDGFFIVRFENLKVVFQSLGQMEQQHPALLQNLSRSQLGLGVQLELNCSDLDAVERSLARAQWPILYELDDRQHLRRELWVQDPDGYLLVLNNEINEQSA